jgi:hypothetical protein
MKPGITGWAPVNGFRGETPEVGMMERRVESDLWYIVEDISKVSMAHFDYPQRVPDGFAFDAGRNPLG